MSLGSTVLIVVALTLLLWLAGTALGFELAFWPSLAISLVLTMILNLVLRAISYRH